MNEATPLSYSRLHPGDPVDVKSGEKEANEKEKTSNAAESAESISVSENSDNRSSDNPRKRLRTLLEHTCSQSSVPRTSYFPLYGSKIAKMQDCQQQFQILK